MAKHRLPVPEKQLPVPPPGFIPLIAGLRDFAILFDVAPRTPDTWQMRGELPIPDGVVSGHSSVWLVSRLEVWAHNTGRAIYPDRLVAARERGERVIRRSHKGDVKQRRIPKGYKKAASGVS